MKLFKITKKMKVIALCILAFLSVWTLTHLSVMLGVGLSSKVEHADAILIFGNTVETSGEPSERLRSRLDKGIELFNQNMAPLIIVSGGFGKEGFDEALVMKKYLINNGLHEDVIMVDQNGIDTYQTAKNIAQIKNDKNISSIIVVSQYYHLLRVKLALNKFGFDIVYLAHAEMFPELRDFYSIPREIIGYYYYLFKNYE